MVLRCVLNLKLKTPNAEVMCNCVEMPVWSQIRAVAS